MDYELLHTLLGFVEVFRPALTAPGFEKALVVFVGWVLSNGPHAVTAALVPLAKNLANDSCGCKVGNMINPEPWISKPRRGPRATPLPLTQEQREAVKAAIRPATAEKRVVKRGEALLLMASGVSLRDTAQAVGVDLRTAFEWRQRFSATDDPVSKLVDAPRSGRPPSLSPRPTRPGLKRKHANRRKMSGSR